MVFYLDIHQRFAQGRGGKIKQIITERTTGENSLWAREAEPGEEITDGDWD